jgi:hypothetical protein
VSIAGALILAFTATKLQARAMSVPARTISDCAW